MAQNISKEHQEQQAARVEREELKAELAAQAANRPRRPVNRRRRVTLMVLAVIAVLVGLMSVFTLLPSSTPAPGGVPVGTVAPAFTLPVYGGGGSGMISLRAELGHPVVLNFWSESCIPCRAEMPYLKRTYTRYAAHGEFALLGINQADPNEGRYRSLWQGISHHLSAPVRSGRHRQCGLCRDRHSHHLFYRQSGHGPVGLRDATESEDHAPGARLGGDRDTVSNRSIHSHTDATILL